MRIGSKYGMKLHMRFTTNGTQQRLPSIYTLFALTHPSPPTLSTNADPFVHTIIYIYILYVGELIARAFSDSKCDGTGSSARSIRRVRQYRVLYIVNTHFLPIHTHIVTYLKHFLGGSPKNFECQAIYYITRIYIIYYYRLYR